MTGQDPQDQHSDDLSIAPVLVVDGSGSLYRVRHRLAKHPEVLSEYAIAAGFVGRLFVYAALGPFQRIYVLFDQDSHQRRQALFAPYKHKRLTQHQQDGQRLLQRRTMRFLHNTLPHLGLVTVTYPGVEADDVAHYLACKHPGGVLVSEDHDWMLNLFPDWQLYFPRTKRFFSYDDLCTFVGSTEEPQQRYLTYKSVLGDASDGVPGIPRIGKKTALPLMQALYTHQQDLGEHQALVERNWQVLSPFWAQDSAEIAGEVAEALALTTTYAKPPFDAWIAFSLLFPAGMRHLIAGLRESYTLLRRFLSCPL